MAVNSNSGSGIFSQLTTAFSGEGVNSGINLFDASFTSYAARMGLNGEMGGAAVDPRLTDDERRVHAATADTSRWVTEEADRKQMNTRRVELVAAKIKSELPPQGEKPTDKLLRVIISDTNELSLALGGNPSKEGLELLNSVTTFVDHADDAPPPAAETAHTTAPETDNHDTAKNAASDAAADRAFMRFMEGMVGRITGEGAPVAPSSKVVAPAPAAKTPTPSLTEGGFSKAAPKTATPTAIAKIPTKLRGPGTPV